MTLTVKSIYGEIGTGATTPLDAEINNKRVVIKLLNNEESNRVLINELVCYELAKLINLPIPNAGVAIVDNTTFVDDSVTIETNQFGKCFYSERINNVTSLVDNKAIFDRYIKNKSDFIKIILFDHIIFNTDRHKGNFLLSIGKKNVDNTLYIIDHTHAFNIGPMWNRYQLASMIEECDYKSEKVMEYNAGSYSIILNNEDYDLDRITNEAKGIQGFLTNDCLRNIIDSVPVEWEMNNEDKEMLFTYLLYRIDNIDKISEVIYNYMINNLRRW